MYVYMCAWSNVCVPEHACVYAGNGWMDRQRMKRWVDLNVCMRVCMTLHACMCKDGMIDARSDG